MAYSSENLVQILYPNEPLEKMRWMVENLDSYAPQLSTYCGWQITLKNRHFSKRPNGWIEVDKSGKVLLQQLVA